MLVVGDQKLFASRNPKLNLLRGERMHEKMVYKECRNGMLAKMPRNGGGEFLTADGASSMV